MLPGLPISRDPQLKPGLHELWACHRVALLDTGLCLALCSTRTVDVRPLATSIAVAEAQSWSAACSVHMPTGRHGVITGSHICMHITVPASLELVLVWPCTTSGDHHKAPFTG